jgi:hypothetical protein
MATALAASLLLHHWPEWVAGVFCATRHGVAPIWDSAQAPRLGESRVQLQATIPRLDW